MGDHQMAKMRTIGVPKLGRESELGWLHGEGNREVHYELENTTSTIDHKLVKLKVLYSTEKDLRK
jgi:hypothetical protein